MEEKTLSLPQCKEYVRNIRDLELSYYAQSRLVGKVQYKINEVLKSVPKDKIMKPYSNPIWMDILFSLGFTGIGALIGGVIGLIFSAFLRGALIGGIAVGGFCILSLLLKPLMDRSDKVKCEKEISIRNSQIREANKKISVLEKTLEEAKKELQETKNVLNKYYALGFIYPKYRGMVPICQICEYLESGRCFSLIGPGGAYNLYESELRQNIIIGKLDDVLDKLDRLSAGQQMLAAAIQENNARIDQLGRSLDRIESNTALSAYYNGITAANTDYLAWLATFS